MKPTTEASCYFYCLHSPLSFSYKKVQKILFFSENSRLIFVLNFHQILIIAFCFKFNIKNYTFVKIVINLNFNLINLQKIFGSIHLNVWH